MFIGPNDPCPCGSGKKYKYCCGKKADVQKSKGLLSESKITCELINQKSEIQESSTSKSMSPKEAYFFNDDDINNLSEQLKAEQLKSITEEEKKKKKRDDAFHALSFALDTIIDAYNDMPRICQLLHITKNVELFKYHTSHTIKVKDKAASSLFHTVFRDQLHFIDFKLYSNGIIEKRDETLRPSGLRDQLIISECEIDEFKSAVQADIPAIADAFASSFYQTITPTRGSFYLQRIAFHTTNVDVDCFRIDSPRSEKEIQNEVKKRFEYLLKTQS